MDNAYDDRCAVIAGGTDQDGLPCGSKAANYSELLGTVTQAHSKVLQQFIICLQQ